MKLRRIKMTVMLLLQLSFFSFATGFAQVADPTISLSGGPSTSPQTALVTLSDSTAGATICYTTDGTIPTPFSSTVNSGSTLLISQNATLKVQAYSGVSSSNLVTSKYTNAGAVSSGARHTLILKSDGTVWATGDNTYGELGNGDASGTAKLNPVQVMVGGSTPLTGIVNVAAGTDESFAVDTSGDVWAWGYNVHGELALGGTSNAPYAARITSLSNAIGIASTQYHTLVLQANGSVWGFGVNTSGQVGDGATASYVTQPTKVIAPTGQSGSLGSIVAVATGANHSLALDNSGKVWAWGADGTGQLGDADSTLTSQSAPVSVLKDGVALTNVIGVAASDTNSFVLRNDGTVFAWGDNSTGELGTGSATPNLTAIQVTGLSNIASVGTEAAIDSDGMVWTWGTNNLGQLGIGYTGYYATLPLKINPLATSSPTITVTSGNGQTVYDGTFSNPFTITAPAGSWVNLIVNPTNGFLGLTSGATQLSPIIGGISSSGGTVAFYLQAPANGSGTVPLTATSGGSQATLSVIEQAAQQIASDTPTMPQWGLILMAVLLIWAATRRRARLA